MIQKTASVDNLNNLGQGTDIFEKSGMSFFGFNLAVFPRTLPLTFNCEEAQMVKHFAPKVIDGKVFIVWRKRPELGVGSPYKKVHEYQSYLKASLKAYMGNCKIASAEAQFMGVAR